MAHKQLLQDIANQLRKGIEIRDRLYKKKVVCPNCFLGKDAVEWLMKTHIAEVASREQAIMLVEEMIQNEVVEPGYDHQSSTFKDSLFYRFFQDREDQEDNQHAEGSWYFPSHVKFNSMAFSAELAEALEVAVHSEDAAATHMAVDTIRRKVASKLEQDKDWVLTQGAGTPFRVYRPAEAPEGSYNLLKTVGYVAESPKDVMHNYIDPYRRGDWMPFFKVGEIVEPLFVNTGRARASPPRRGGGVPGGAGVGVGGGGGGGGSGVTATSGMGGGRGFGTPVMGVPLADMGRSKSAGADAVESAGSARGVVGGLGSASSTKGIGSGIGGFGDIVDMPAGNGAVGGIGGVGEDEDGDEDGPVQVATVEDMMDHVRDLLEKRSGGPGAGAAGSPAAQVSYMSVKASCSRRFGDDLFKQHKHVVQAMLQQASTPRPKPAPAAAAAAAAGADGASGAQTPGAARRHTTDGSRSSKGSKGSPASSDGSGGGVAGGGILGSAAAASAAAGDGGGHTGGNAGGSAGGNANGDGGSATADPAGGGPSAAGGNDAATVASGGVASSGNATDGGGTAEAKEAKEVKEATPAAKHVTTKLKAVAESGLSVRPRVVQWELARTKKFSSRRTLCVLQDFFVVGEDIPLEDMSELDDESGRTRATGNPRVPGTTVVYEISIIHREVAAAPKTVRAEVLLMAWAAAPVTAPVEQNPSAAASASTTPSSAAAGQGQGEGQGGGKKAAGPQQLSKLTCIAQFHPRGASGGWLGVGGSSASSSSTQRLPPKKADLSWVQHGGKRYEEGRVDKYDAEAWKEIIAKEANETMDLLDDKSKDSRAGTGAGGADGAQGGDGSGGAGGDGGSGVPGAAGDAVNIRDFEILAVLGRGGYGKVLQVRYQRADGTASDDEVLAMKVLHKREVVRRHQVGRTHVERKIMSLMDHPFIVALKFSFQSPTKLYMVMEYAPGGDFFTHLHRDGPLCESAARLYTAQLALALQHLHDHGIIYRDLKPENVLLDITGNIKLVDFGLSRLFGMNDRKTAPGYVPPESPGAAAAGPTGRSGDVTYSFCGTEQYMAPEMLLQDPDGYNFAVDWWTLGLFMCEMLTGRHPFKGENHYNTLRNIVSKSRDPYIDNKAIMFARGNTERRPLSGDAINIIRLFLDRDKTTRLGSGPRIAPPGLTPQPRRGAAAEATTVAGSAGGAAPGLVGGLEQIKCHPFFKTSRSHRMEAIDWDAVLNKDYRVGIVPNLDGETDTRNFDAVFTRERPVDSVAPEDAAAARPTGGATGGGGGFLSMFSSRLLRFRGGEAPAETKQPEDAMRPVPGVPDQNVFDDFSYTSPAMIDTFEDLADADEEEAAVVESVPQETLPPGLGGSNAEFGQGAPTTEEGSSKAGGDGDAVGNEGHQGRDSAFESIDGLDSVLAESRVSL